MQGKAKRQDLKNAALFAGMPLSPSVKPNAQNPYTGQQRRYFAPATDDYTWENAQYASNYFAAKVQGVIPGKFEDIRGAYIRTMDIVEQTTGGNMPNDFQLVYFQDPTIRGLYTGAKLWYAGNTWLATSPFNMASAVSNSVIRRCNAVWNHLDYYGNVLSEPFVWSKGPAQATANEYLDYSVIPNEYQKCVMQLNESTKELAINRRMVLGSSAFEVRGVVDFVCDFSDVQMSDGSTEIRTTSEPCHVLFFDLQYQQPLEIDDMEREIAGGKAFSWVINAEYAEEMQAGTHQTISVSSLRNGESPDTAHEVTYSFASSNEQVATVDPGGRIASVSPGTAEITIVLNQNPSITRVIELTVTEAGLSPIFQIDPPLPDSISQLQQFTAKVSVEQNGEALNTDITMTASGPPDYAYSAELNDGTLSINAWSASEVPLTLTFTTPELGISTQKKIELRGY